jgi:hypothetical protein
MEVLLGCLILRQIRHFPAQRTIPVTFSGGMPILCPTSGPALFQVPAGFKKVEKIIDPTQKQMTYWQWFKEKLHEWFG